MRTHVSSVKVNVGTCLQMAEYQFKKIDQLSQMEQIEDYDHCRFAWQTDPEGNRVELWEPSGQV